MPEPIIEVRNLSKRYRLGSFGRHTFRERLDEWWRKTIQRREASEHHGMNGNGSGKGGDRDFWALKDVSFEVGRGEVVGIIGRNGAGKSTLLKILSRITEPTKGDAILHGRVASLLEVGTGFHPELTGRENIFLNGSILGMKHAEIRARFDEIIDFAGVEKFLDTPVKRYSSGMYVRLAFGVAAHLDPEILIIDEVLAVGDTEFQKKCLGKMNAISKQGRTVLFVSHNMGAISSLCTRGLLLESGRVSKSGPAADVVMAYYTREHQSPAAVDYDKIGVRVGDDYAELLGCCVKNSEGEVAHNHDIDQPITISMRYRILQKKRFDKVLPYPQVNIVSSNGTLVFESMAPPMELSAEAGEYLAECRIPGNFLNNETYYASVCMATCDPLAQLHFHERDILCFQVVEQIERSVYSKRNGYTGKFYGCLRPELDWEIERIGESVARRRLESVESA